jgi:hypothetical protein
LPRFQETGPALRGAGSENSAFLEQKVAGPVLLEPSSGPFGDFSGSTEQIDSTRTPYSATAILI